MEKPKDQKPLYDEMTIAQRGKDWDAIIQSAYPNDESAAHSTQKLPEDELAQTPHFQGELLLRHYESHTEFRISNKALQKPFMIGRADFNTGFLPEINLAKLDEKLKTVSRRHASIRPHGELLVITDHKSLNGTYLNSQRLVPEQSWILQNGDMLRFGKICLIVYFVNENEKDVPFSDTPSHPNR